MNVEQDTPGSDKLLRWPLKKKNTVTHKYTKYSNCTKHKVHIIKATLKHLKGFVDAQLTIVFLIDDLQSSLSETDNRTNKINHIITVITDIRRRRLSLSLYSVVFPDSSSCYSEASIRSKFFCERVVNAWNSMIYDAWLQLTRSF